ncbi:MAG: hypothetical protein B1H03_01500 [Planctomycetales bacterium 4484_113]|nr:MAG: hypothetical protein B1H03_01500 [Planctomycetales bacterium 4484_113]
MKTQSEKLYRSRSNRWLGGVCGGLARHFGFDPNILRVIWLVMVVVSPTVFALLYLLAWVIIPGEPWAIAARGDAETYHPESRGVHISAGVFWGVLLIVLGTIFLLGESWLRAATGLIAPVALLVLGILLVAGKLPHNSSERRDEK